MFNLKALIITVICIFLFPGLSSGTSDDEFPKVGFVRNNQSNVRAGDNINFESLCKLEKGDPIKIVGKRYSWYKILLPKKAYLYIKNDFITLGAEKNIGEVNARRVNLRAGPGTKYSILGQVSKPQKLNVLQEIDGWYKVTPPEGIEGWIHSSQVTFSLGDIEIKGRFKSPDNK